ncbi:unnamed protein product [Orchesella dallaii]|uniref:Transmembrane protein n=1 Tax=Orchesella dallaii TaxID=48710 RepID=A0ABP1PZI1_9HEXA
MTLSPCPCMPLQAGVIIFAVIDIVIGILNLGLFLLVLVGLLAIGLDGDFGDVDKGVAFLIVISAIFIASVQLMFAFRLYHGGKTKDINKCRSWLIATIIIITIYVITLVSDKDYRDSRGVGFAIISALAIYKIYEIATVVAFIEQLKWNFVANHSAVILGEGNHVAPYIVANDLPPSYLETQNQPYVEPPPPYHMEPISPEKRESSVALQLE